jgi:hypothetical protein
VRTTIFFDPDMRVDSIKLKTPLAEVLKEEYLSMAAEISSKDISKMRAPLCVYISNIKSRRQSDIIGEGKGMLEAIPFDFDSNLRSEGQIIDILDSLRSRNITFHAQYRKKWHKWKAHIIIPLKEPIPLVSKKHYANLYAKLSQDLFPNCIIDKAFLNNLTQGMFLYSTLSGAAPTNIWFEGSDFDLRAYIVDFPDCDVSSSAAKYVSKKSPEERADNRERLSKFVSLFEVIRTDEDKFCIKCPHNHENAGETTTVIFKNRRELKIQCFAEKCAGKPMGWFISKLKADQHSAFRDQVYAELFNGQDLPEFLTVGEATERIKQELAAVNVSRGDLSVLKITTGAGKTFAASSFLNDYCKPFDDADEDAVVGRPAIFSTPTNKLLGEFESQIKIPHKRIMGGLSILDDDGNPECKQHDLASKISNAGSNFYKVLCPKCPFKKECKVKEKSRQGEGLLAITNHAVTTGLIKEQSKMSRPLVIWDESPQLTQVDELRESEVTHLSNMMRHGVASYMPDMLAGKINKSATKNKMLAMSKPVVAALTPVLSFIAYTFKQTKDNQEATVEMSATYYNSWVRSVHAKTSLQRAVDALTDAGVIMSKRAAKWERLQECLTFARSRIFAGVDFNTAPANVQDSVLKTEDLLRRCESFLGGKSVLQFEFSIEKGRFITVCSLSETADVMANYGGVIMDATANASNYTAIAADARIVDIVVKDSSSNKVIREFNYNPNMFRSAFTGTLVKKSYRELAITINECKSRVAAWAKTNSIDTPKIVVITYKGITNKVKELWPEVETLHFGNTRGYDHLFQNKTCVYITIGDPIDNIDAINLTHTTLYGQMLSRGSKKCQDYIIESAKSELAQAHGRARSVQPAKTDHKCLLHIHYGRHIPSGWYQPMVAVNLDNHPYFKTEEDHEEIQSETTTAPAIRDVNLGSLSRGYINKSTKKVKSEEDADE